MQQLCYQILHFLNIPWFNFVLRCVLNQTLRRQFSLLCLNTSRAQCSDSKKLHAGWNHLSLGEIPVDNVDSDMNWNTLKLEVWLHLKEPVNKIHAHLLSNSALLRHVVKAGVIVHFFITNLIVKFLDMFWRIKFVWLRPEKELWLVHIRFKV